jgi:hypothetical protein
MESKEKKPRVRYEPPSVSAVHIDPVKDLLMACGKASDGANGGACSAVLLTLTS